jgi:hypothetical protein
MPSEKLGGSCFPSFSLLPELPWTKLSSTLLCIYEKHAIPYNPTALCNRSIPPEQISPSPPSYGRLGFAAAADRRRRHSLSPTTAVSIPCVLLLVPDLLQLANRPCAPLVELAPEPSLSASVPKILAEICSVPKFLAEICSVPKFFGCCAWRTSPAAPPVLPHGD